MLKDNKRDLLLMQLQTLTQKEGAKGKEEGTDHIYLLLSW